MNRLKRIYPIVLQLLLLLALTVPAAAADFTQADLEKIVADLDKVITHNPNYKYPVKCSIVDKDEANAYAALTEEGKDMRATMVVFSGLVKRCNGDQRLLRAVVAHELSHLSLGHNMDINPGARDLNNLWTRQQEMEADKNGAACLVKAGYAKKDMVDMLLFLESLRPRYGDWLGRLTADHPDPKARAAAVSDNPNAFKALVMFDTGLAYTDARNYNTAKKIFDAAADEWPSLTEAYINAGKCDLMFYYDSLPDAVRFDWWRPDFGPMLTKAHAPLSQDVRVSDEDRERWADAMASIQKAIDNNKGSDDAAELMALAQVLEPDAKKDIVQKGIDWYKSHLSAADEVSKLRYANNIGVGFQRIGNLQSAYDSIIAAQKATTVFNSALGENLGLVKVTGRSKDDDVLAANVLFTWLTRTPQMSPRWATVKKTFDETCTSAGITPKALDQQPIYLCHVLSIMTSGKEVGMLMPVATATSVLGRPELRVTFTDRFPGLAELRWNNAGFTMFTEGDTIMRVTSYQPGDYVVLRPEDSTVKLDLKIKVGMSRDDFNKIIDEKGGVKKDLARGGKMESWLYYPDLELGVLLENDVVKGITVSPIVQE